MELICHGCQNEIISAEVEVQSLTSAETEGNGSGGAGGLIKIKNRYLTFIEEKNIPMGNQNLLRGKLHLTNKNLQLCHLLSDFSRVCKLNRLH